MKRADMNPITEDDIANFLVNTPDFFERHAEVLAAVKLTSPHGRRAVSLQERQAEMLRDKIRVLELRMMDMLRHGNENEVLLARQHTWVKTLLATTQARDLPSAIAEGIAHDFLVPQVAIKVWGVAKSFQKQAFASGVSETAKAFAAGLSQPFVGMSAGIEAVTWLSEPQAAQSVALIPLRANAASAGDAPVGDVIGLLVLASPDAQRYHEGMGTAFIERLGELASAALSHLR